MQQIAVNQMNGTSGGSLRQKLDLSDACQATDAFAMLFMQLMGQTIQPEALLQMQGEQPLTQTDAVLPAAAGTVGSMASGNEMQAMLADLIQNAGSTPAEGAFLQTFAQQYFEQRQQHRGGHWQQEDDSFEAVIGQTQAPDSELDAYI